MFQTTNQIMFIPSMGIPEINAEVSTPDSPSLCRQEQAIPSAVPLPGYQGYHTPSPY